LAGVAATVAAIVALVQGLASASNQYPRRPFGRVRRAASDEV
jgi:hypothetical protein